jgi:hypothetical protein
MSNITCNNISNISHNHILDNIYQLNINSEYNQFEIFLATIISLMPVSKKYSQSIKIDILRRKINQYTNWNILMIIVNSMMYNIFNIDNNLISRFIAINSFQIMTLFHLFILYDSNILFYAQDIKPFILKYNVFNKISDFHLVRFEYFICNLFVHILPVYMYRDFLTIKNVNENGICVYNNINMFQYIIMFKFMWVLNIFGDFNITSIYVPSFKGCNVKLINLVVTIDYITYKLINYFLYKI